MKKTFTLIIIFILSLVAENKAQVYIPQSVQLAHNSADPTISNLKIWVNDSVWVNSLGFQQATPKLSFVASTHTIGISYTSATSQTQSLVQYTFDFNTNIDGHFLAVHGILGNTVTPLMIKDYSMAPVGMIAPTDSYYNLYNGCVNCGVFTVNASCPSAQVSFAPVNSMNYNAMGMIQVQTNSQSNTNHTLTFVAITDTSTLGTFALPLQNCFQKFNEIIMNGAYNQAAKGAAGSGFGLALVPVAGGSITPLKKITTNTGINELYNSSIQISLSPNPANTVLRVSINTSESDMVNIEVIDLLGKKVMALSGVKTTDANPIQLNIAALNAGVYFLKINQGASQKSLKFVKE